MLRTAHANRLVRASVAAILGTSLALPLQAADNVEPSLDEVTVTGSRIVRRDLQAASPIVTVESQAFDENSSLAMETVLNQLPQFVPANTQFVAADIQPGPMNTPGISTLNMRGLGSNRTLVLIDGRRGQPANASLVVDINSIPSAAISSVEIISGGASAVYGADAMGGVTNFKLRDNFQGAVIDLRGGFTEPGDGEEYRVSSLLGVNLGGSGNAMLGLEWMRREAASQDNRDFFRAGLYDPTTGGFRALSRLNHIMYSTTASNNAPSQAAVNALFPTLQPGQNVATTGVFYFNDNRSSIFKTERSGIGFTGPVGEGDYRVVNNNLVQNEMGTLLSSPMDRVSIFGNAKFDFNEHVGAFSRAMFVSTEVLNSRMRGAPVYDGFGADIPHGNQVYGPSLAANGVDTLPQYQAGGALGLSCPATGGCTASQAFPTPASLTSLLDSRGPNVLSTTQFDPATGQPIIERGAGSTWRLGIVPEWLDKRSVLSRTQLYQVLAGLEGKLGLGDWTWEAYVSHGETRTTANYSGQAATNVYHSIVESPNYGRNVTLTGIGGKTLTCTSGIPIFEDFWPTQDCIDAVNITAVDRTDLEQDIAEANFQGGLFELPAGQIRAAAGLSWRRNSFSFLPDSSRDITKITDVPAGAFGGTPVGGETRVKEIYGELLIPLLRDLPLVRSLELELGARYSEYNTGSSVPTYKALFSWAPADYLRFRGGYQLANRAPNVNELYSGVTNVVSGGVDPCTTGNPGPQPWGNVPGNPNRADVQRLCSAIINNPNSDFDANPNGWFQVGGVAAEIAVQSGNPDLESEEGTTWTLGFVLQSPFRHPAASGMSLAVDWYQANIENAISTVSNTTTYQLCFNQDGASNPTWSINDPNGMCSRIERDESTGNRVRTLTPYSNLGVLETSGIDLSFNWRASFEDIGLQSLPGYLALDVSLNYLLSFDEQDFPSQPARDLKGTASRGGLFDYRTVTTLRYGNGAFQTGLNWRYMPRLDHTNVITDPNTTTRGTSSYSVFNLFAGYDINSNLSVSGGIDNLFDTDPPVYGATPTVNAWGQTLTSVYDVLGRRYYATVRFRF